VLAMLCHGQEPRQETDHEKANSPLIRLSLFSFLLMSIASLSLLLCAASGLHAQSFGCEQHASRPGSKRPLKKKRIRF
jgi:hypothetical protein